MRTLTTLVASALLLVGFPTMAQETVASSPSSGGQPYGRLSQGTVVFNQGPSTGSNGGCWHNETNGQNFADQAVFPADAEIEEVRVFTCVSAMSGAVHVKILVDDGSGAPAGVVYSEDKVADSWLHDPTSGGFVVSVVLTTPFQVTAGTIYWYGISYDGADMGQYSVLAPGDGTMAQFSGSMFQFHTPVGDQMFQLVGTMVPVELQSFVAE